MMDTQAVIQWWRQVSGTIQLPGALSTDIAVHGNCSCPLSLGLIFDIDVVFVKVLLAHCLDPCGGNGGRELSSNAVAVAYWCLLLAT